MFTKEWGRGKGEAWFEQIIVHEFQAFFSVGILWPGLSAFLPSPFSVIVGGMYLKWELEILHKGSSLLIALVCRDTKKRCFLPYSSIL